MTPAGIWECYAYKSSLPGLIETARAKGFSAEAAANLAFGRADADGKDLQTGLGRLLRLFHGARIVVLAIAEEHEHFVIFAFLKSRHCGLNRFGQGRAALRYNIDVQRFDALTEGHVVNG